MAGTSGIGAIGVGAERSAWWQARYFMNVSAARSAGSNPARPETPVEPVEPVRAISPEVPVRMPVVVPETQLPTEDALQNASDVLGRMRVQMPGEDTSQLQLLMGLGGKQEAPAALNGLPGAPAPQNLPGLPGLPGDEEDAEGEEDAENLGIWESKSAAQIMNETKCQACARRKYQDGSDDPGVSFKSPTQLSPEEAPAAVRGHEQEHVVRERAEAEREGRKVVNQSVTIHTDICPECGRVYVSGGVTRTVTAEDNDPGEEEDSLLPGAGKAGKLPGVA